VSATTGSSPRDRRVAAIGLDAAEWTLVEEMLDAGELPHLAALRERSLVARLDDPVDYRTGLVWEHFLTGRSAAGNGRWAAVEFDPATYEVWQEGARPVEPFYAGAPLVRGVLFDVPYTSIAFPVDGAVVVGWGGHDPGYPRASSPPGLLRELDERFGPHPACGNDYEIVWYRPDAIDRLCDALVVGTRRRADAAAWLLSRQPDWELFATVLSEPHSAGEQLWHGIDDVHPTSRTPTAPLARRRLREVYRAVDDAVGRLVAGFPSDTTVVAFSMHGTGPNNADVASMALLPELLFRLQTGEARLGSRSGSGPLGPPIVPKVGWTPAVQREFGTEPLLRRARGAVAARLDRVRGRGCAHDDPQLTVGALGHPIAAETDLTPEEIGVPRSSVEWQIAMRYQDCWPRLEAFALPTFYDGRIRINVAGRERDGVVPIERYAEVCDRLEAELHACVEPHSGAPLVDRVDRLRADDPMAPRGPDADLVVVWARAADALEHPRVGRIGPVPYRRTGGHSERGFAFVSGPGIEPGDIGVRPALDLPATIAALIGRSGPKLEGASFVDGAHGAPDH
jgi:predicted AlkP superfamily phosphohydrolase/phosphomutase